jgi:hypothetical protein
MAKLGEYEQQSLAYLWHEINRAVRLALAWPVPNSDIPLIRDAFHPAMLSKLMLLNGEIAHTVSNPTERAFFHTALFAILENCSRAQKAGGWLRLGPEAPPETVLMRSFNAQVKRMLADAPSRRVLQAGHWSVAVGDARTHIAPMEVAGVISSPPYLNRHDYTRIFCLELALGFVSGQEELKALRYGSLRSHVEARGNAGNPDYRMPDRLAALLPVLVDRGINDSRLLRMITGYFEDMHATLLAIKASLVPGGFVALVLGNSRFSGVTIPVDEIVAEIGEQIGLTWSATWVARHRGNSAQQMASYGRAPSRESVILWTNDG